jgi:hypothetical protein
MLMSTLHVEGLWGLTGKRKKKKEGGEKDRERTRIFYPVSVLCSK